MTPAFTPEYRGDPAPVTAIASEPRPEVPEKMNGQVVNEFQYAAAGHVFFRRSEPFETNGYDYYYNNSDGTLVRRVKVGATAEDTIYVGDLYERKLSGATETITKYYYADGRRIAMRTGSTLYFLATDHLGGTSVVMNSAGSLVNRVRYYPFGSIRTQDGGTPVTDRLFTGQQRLSENGIYNYGARLYDARLGRFLQADAIVPGAGNPQALNRYSYVLNNPLRYTDPSGNVLMDGGGGGSGGAYRWCDTGGCVSAAGPLPGVPCTMANPAGGGVCTGDASYSGGYGSGGWLTGLSIALGSIPYVGDANDLIAYATGCSLVEAVCGLSPEERGLYLIAALGPGVSGRMLKNFANAADLIRANRARGLEFEELAGIARGSKNSGRIYDTLSGRYRVPDQWLSGDRIIVEAKSSMYIPYTSQLRDMADWAGRNGYKLELRVPVGARFSQPLQTAVDSGEIVRTDVRSP